LFVGCTSFDLYLPQLRSSRLHRRSELSEVLLPTPIEPPPPSSPKSKLRLSANTARWVKGTNYNQLALPS
jgi:hypothetical protein